MATEVVPGRFSSLDPCVHCGFCLPACPTYLATGDEADSPRGRIVLMRALERGEIPATDAALGQHLDACLGCRGCEPVCPSGVGYGRGLEAARELLYQARGMPGLARFTLWVFQAPWRWRALFGTARRFRDGGLARRLAGSGRLGFTMGMLAATRGMDGPDGTRPKPPSRPSDQPTVSLFLGCVMESLFSHVHQATRRTLEANGYRVVEVAGQTCCGALHEHAGDRAAATALARANIRAFASSTGPIAVNSAGCGALLKDYGHLLDTAEARAFAARIRDVSELLAERGPRPGAPLAIDVAYDAPCHLQHAQRVHQQPLALLGAIPGLRLHLLPGFDRCCGSAGIYGLLQPELSRDVLQDKLNAISAAEPRPQIIATGNPGCLMQIGAGCLAAGLPIEVRHPVELLDRSYQAAGLY
jgi:glycolate oxidase iron-sulfur subunit